MKSNQENENYWLKLLRDEKISPDLWNLFLSYQFPSRVKSLIFEKEKIKRWSDISEMSEKEIDKVKKIEEKYGKPPKLYYPILTQPYMNFSKIVLDSKIPFEYRIFIWADFRNTEFIGPADFRETVFLGTTHFEGCIFRGELPVPKWIGDADVFFTKSLFELSANFKGVQFPYRTRFDQVRFNRSAYFQKAKFGKESIRDGFVDFGKSNFKSVVDFELVVFNGTTNFSNSRFTFVADFSETKFNNYVDFDNIEFNCKTNFFKTQFTNDSNFNNSKFRNTLSFSKASFSQPPKFFNTEFHEDIDFYDTNWSIAERFYSHNHRQNADTETIIEDANNAIRAWDRLALIMSKQEKPAERHVFFRLKMRAQRQRDGFIFLTILNCLFEELSDYGWGVGRALLWWGLNIYLGAIILGFVATYQISGGIQGFVACKSSGGCVSHLKMFGNSLLVSFSNSVSFLGLGSGGGHLYGSSIAVRDAIVKAIWVFPMVGSVQAVIGPILLFLVLLTLRNRFRIK